MRRFPLSPITALVATTAAVAGCGGPNYQFDPAPAPGWTREMVSNPTGATITAVGASPVTADLRRDRDLATRDAKAQVALLFQSRVKSEASDWTLVVASDGRSSEQSVAQQHVDVQSNVTVEDVQVTSTYRDEASRTQYVGIEVDRRAWLSRLKGRLADGLDEMRGALEAAESALATGRPLAALGHLLDANATGRRIEPDIVVIDLLDQSLGVRGQLRGLKERLDDGHASLRRQHPVAVEVRCTDSAVAAALVAQLVDFLNGYGFRHGDGSDAIRVVVDVGQQYIAEEHVANRLEYVHAARGRLQVFEPSGDELTALAGAVADGRYRERDVDPLLAARKALTLAADTLGAKLRSAFRDTYPQP